MRRELDTLGDLKFNLLEKRETKEDVRDMNQSDYWEFAAPMSVQLRECLKRIALQYWRSPSYIYSKTALTVLEVSVYPGTFSCL